MFQKINVRSDSKKGGLDLGFLGESLIFYGTVNVYGSGEALEVLVRQLGPEAFIRLHREGRLQFYFYKALPIVLTADEGSARERYDYGFVSAPKKGETPNPVTIFSPAKVLQRWLDPRTSKAVTAVLRSADVEKLNLPVIRRNAWQEGVLGPLMSAWVDAITDGKIHLPPDSLKCWKLGEMLQVGAPIDLAELNSFPAAKGWNMPRFLSEVLNAYEDLHSAAVHNADIGTTSTSGPMLSTIAEIHMAAIKERLARKERFEELVFGRSNAISETINSGSRTLSELIPVLEKASKFRTWLDGVNPDADLVHEYYRAVTKETWIDTLPGKAVRWVVSKLAGAAADSAAAGASAGVEVLDAVVLDRVLRGWRPNQFVDGPLKKFVMDPADNPKA